nr:TIM barrel protein [Candidatus Sigynarchaeota archaeon]
MPIKRNARTAFNFFNAFIPAHTVDFLASNEVKARLDITSQFLKAYPVKDVGFEFVVFPKKLEPADIATQASNYAYVKQQLESKFGVKVHASMHFPTRNDMDFFLGSDETSTRQRVMSMFDRCLDLALRTGIRTIVVHSGGNITMREWERMRDGYPKKQRQLHAIAERLRDMLQACATRGYIGKLAWENVPWPFDVPAFTFTNVVKHDFAVVLSDLQSMAIKNRDQLGICIDLCHSWIISQVAKKYASMAIVPPGIYPEERDDFLALVDINNFIEAFAGRYTHVHLADSAGEFASPDGTTVLSQPTEGDELGTGDFSRSPAFAQSLQAIGSHLPAGEKLLCTLEVKDADFSNPEKALRSLLFLGAKFFSKKGTSDQ